MLMTEHNLTFYQALMQAMREAMTPLVDELIRQQHMAWLGGDHSITLPLLRSYRRHFGRPLAVIHFDAHCDTWRDHFGEPSGHGTWLAGIVAARTNNSLGIAGVGYDYVQVMPVKVLNSEGLGEDGEIIAVFPRVLVVRVCRQTV